MLAGSFSYMKLDIATAPSRVCSFAMRKWLMRMEETERSRPARRRSALLLSRFLRVALLTAINGTALAQRTNPSDPAAQAERKLSAVYERSLQSLREPDKESLREAGRAWIEFTRKNWAAWVSLRGEILTDDMLAELSLDELRERTAHLEAFFVTFQYPYADSKELKETLDTEIDRVYARCLQKLSPEAATLLREAQRAWLKYRDLDADAAVLASRLYYRSFKGYSAKAHLTKIRMEQLRWAYLESQSSRNKALPKAEPSISAATLKFQKAAAAFIAARAGDGQEVLFAKEPAFSQAPKFEAKMLAELEQLDRSAREVIGTFSIEQLDPVAAEIATLGILRKWISFVTLIAEGNIRAASEALPNAKKQRPEMLSQSYATTWDAVERWEESFVAAHAKYGQHIKQAQAAAGLGKNLEAIREYEAAFGLLRDAGIPAAVKRLRNQTLGL
jgi:uncharacterized protein YecT (DUF1311 family)